MQTGKVIDTVICQSDPSQSYALYIPTKGNQTALPILYLFDSHGDGSFPLDKYKSLAETYGFILVGSNNSKNGNDWPATEHIWTSLSMDTRSRLNVDTNRIYTVGFSGGAKVAGYVAIMYPGIKGVIAGGAGLPDGVRAGDFDFSFTALAGEGDMNLTDLISFNTGLDRTHTRHRFILFDGKHEWAPAPVMETAFAGLQLDAMQKGFLPKDQGLIRNYVAESEKRIDAYEKEGRWTRAWQECSVSVSLLDGVSDSAAWFGKKAAALEATTQYQQQRRTEQALLVREESTKETYSQHFQQADLTYWNNTIADLQTKASVRSDEQGMYQRLLAFLSLAFYSFSNRFIAAGQNDAARHFVDLYKLDDPTNSEGWYFSAILDARAGQAAQADLLKAVQYGFRDVKRMREQPEFQQLDLSAVIQAMH